MLTKCTNSPLCKGKIVGYAGTFPDLRNGVAAPRRAARTLRAAPSPTNRRCKYLRLCTIFQRGIASAKTDNPSDLQFCLSVHRIFGSAQRKSCTIAFFCTRYDAKRENRAQLGFFARRNSRHAKASAKKDRGAFRAATTNSISCRFPIRPSGGQVPLVVDDHLPRTHPVDRGEGLVEAGEGLVTIAL